MLEIVIIIELRLVHPNGDEMRIYHGAQGFESRIIRQSVLVRFTVDVGYGAKQQLFICRQNEVSFDGGENKCLFLSPPVGFDLVTIVSCSVRQFCFFKLLLAFEELCCRNLLLTHRRNENQIQPPNVVNRNGRAGVSRAADRRGIERKTKRVIELFPALNQLQSQMTMLELLVVCAVQILLLE